MKCLITPLAPFLFSFLAFWSYSLRKFRPLSILVCFVTFFLIFGFLKTKCSDYSWFLQILFKNSFYVAYRVKGIGTIVSSYISPSGCILHTCNTVSAPGNRHWYSVCHFVTCGASCTHHRNHNTEVLCHRKDFLLAPLFVSIPTPSSTTSLTSQLLISSSL